MKKYYLHDGTEQTGPFSIQELKKQNINEHSHIWYEGLSDWTTIANTPELHFLVPKTSDDGIHNQPTIPIQANANNSSNNHDTGRFLGIVLCFMGILFFLYFLYQFYHSYQDVIAGVLTFGNITIGSRFLLSKKTNSKLLIIIGIMLILASIWFLWLRFPEMIYQLNSYLNYD